MDQPKKASESTVPVTVTYLEMTSPLGGAPSRNLADAIEIRQAKQPTVSFYRYLYNTVGADWNWYMRRRLTDGALLEIIGDERIAVYVLYVEGTPAGYVELDRRIEGEIEIAYLGLIPEFIGRGLGGHLLDWGLPELGITTRVGFGCTPAPWITLGRSTSTGARDSWRTGAR